jgi:peptidoglycan/LPS O-acetylase OafA/YrhL
MASRQVSPRAEHFELPQYVPGLDYLRGLAVLLVVLYHGLYWSDNGVSHYKIVGTFLGATVFGWLGVNLFFVLSGFLITGILLDTKTKPDYFKRFYERRSRRILPAYFLTILLLLAGGLFTVHDILPAVFFLSNLTSLTHFPKHYGPFWSLAVEEQFYLVWPVTVLLLKGRTALAWFSVGICFAEPILRLLSFLKTPYMGDVSTVTWLTADNLAIGALLAIFCRSTICTTRSIKWLAALLFSLGVILLITLIPLGILHRDSALGAALQSVPWNLIFAACLLTSLQVGDQLKKLRILSFLPFLGYISYGLYLIHVLTFDLYDKVAASNGLPGFHGRLDLLLLRLLVVFVIAVGAATLSRATIEDWFLAKKKTRQTSTPVPRDSDGVSDLEFQRP